MTSSFLSARHNNDLSTANISSSLQHTLILDLRHCFLLSCNGGRMAISLRKLFKKSIVASCFNFREAQLHPTSDLHGFLCCSSSELLSRGERQAGREGGFRRQQMRLLYGSPLPLSRPSHYHPHRDLHYPCSEVPCVLSHSFSQLVLQETLLVLDNGCFRSRAFSTVSDRRLVEEEEIIISDSRDGGCRSLPFSLNFPFSFLRLSSRYEFPFLRSPSFSSIAHLVSRGKTFNLDSRALNYRSFSRVSDEDAESDEEVEDDCNDVRKFEDVKSAVDPKEVSKVCEVIEELFASDRNMEAVLDQCSVKLSHDLVADVLVRFCHAWRPAFRFFRWVEQKPGFSHNSRTYNMMMGILGKTRQFESMVVMLEEMGKRGLLTMDTFSIAIRAFASARERKKAVGVFELMKRHNFKTEIETFNCLLDDLGRAKLAKEAQALFEKLKDRFPPDLQTYSVLLAGWCKVKNLMEAGKMWNEMIDKGLKPDIVAHNIMLHGLLSCQRSSDSIKLFELMKTKGPSPNVRSYTILIRHLCKRNKMDQAVGYFDEMLDSGCQPDPAVYTCLILGFGNEKKMDKVYGLLMEMKEKGCPPDEQTYNALIKLMTNRQMSDDAVKIYKKMIQNGLQPTIHTYNMMMKSYFREKNYEMGHAVWDEMRQKGICPDDNSYTVLIGGLIRLGRSEEARRYIEEVIEKGMRAPQLDYNRFAADLSTVGKSHVLDELAQKMKLLGKFEASSMFARFSEMTKKRFQRQDTQRY